MEQEINYCPRCGSAVTLIERFGHKRPVCPQCGWTYFADPKVAVAVLLEQDNLVLLVRRLNEPFRGLWSLPAGYVDAGEDPARAAERECLEETGLKVQTTHVLDIIAGREHPRGADFIIVYHGLVVSGQLHASDDADRAEWFDRSHLPVLAFRATQTVLAKT